MFTPCQALRLRHLFLCVCMLFWTLSCANKNSDDNSEDKNTNTTTDTRPPASKSDRKENKTEAEKKKATGTPTSTDTDSNTDTETEEDPLPPPPPDDPKKKPKLPPITKFQPIPPRAAFADEDFKVLRNLFDSDVTQAYPKVAEIFQFDGFRAVASKKKSGETPRVLLLTYDIRRLEEILNMLATVAKKIHEKGDAANKERLESFYTVPFFSLDANDGLQPNVALFLDAFIKEVAPTKEMQKLWPQGRQLELVFGTERVLFVYSKMDANSFNSIEALKGEEPIQTPWILRSLEGKNIKALWQAVSRYQAEAVNIQFGTQSELERWLWSAVFERIWDSRSPFFPATDILGRQYAHRIIDYFAPFRSSQGSRAFGYEELIAPTIGELREVINQLRRVEGFTFKNENNES